MSSASRRLPPAYRTSTPGQRLATLKDLHDAGYTWRAISAMVGASESMVHRDWHTGKGTFALPRWRRFLTIAARLAAAGACFGSGRDEFVASPSGRPLGYTGPISPEVRNHAATRVYAAYRTCCGCPVKAECLELVDPAGSHFTGVAGGRIWQHGTDVTRKTTERVYHLKHAHSSPCGECARKLA